MCRRDSQRQGGEPCRQHLEPISENDKQVRCRLRVRAGEGDHPTTDRLGDHERRVVVAEKVEPRCDAEAVSLDLADGRSETLAQVHAGYVELELYVVASGGLP